MKANAKQNYGKKGIDKYYVERGGLTEGKKQQNNRLKIKSISAKLKSTD